ncbi:NAD(P)-dependent oxidoreductase [Paenibacillus tyrfis]|uniref:NAD(P)H-binding protein n=1 Tax=Paenibacillus tyrfis TaxID=1501230 RepID=UPI00249388BD|nr:NAD(P)H-binding protein [Paenibacillus tyrfis]GLI10611.1 NAD(P)-dependent oxidoreductase [Paenibacillus tyrfis]
MTILITGATGQLGRLIVGHLLQKVEAGQIIACVRHPEKAADFARLGIEVRYGDYDRPESLAEAYAGAGGAKLLLISSPHPDDTVRIRQHVHAIEAAKQAQVGHLVYTGFAYPEKSSVTLTQLHLATEYAIRTTGIPYTFLRSALYTDFLAAIGLKEAAARGELITYPGDWAFNAVTRDDLALAAAAVLTEEGHDQRSYELTAPRSWTFGELAQTVSELTGKPVIHREDSAADSWLYRFLARIDTSSTSPDLERLIGRSATTLRETVKRLIGA